MTFYPPKINERFENPRNAGKIADSNAEGRSATFVCGAILKIYLRIDKKNKKISKAKFQTNGCGYLTAAADFLAEMLEEKILTDLHGLDDGAFQAEIEAALGEFPAHRRHCLELVTDALKRAFADFRVAQIVEFSGEKALICTCFGVSEEKIERIITEKSLETVEQVSDLCNAGDGCGACRPLIQELLDVHGQSYF